MIAEILLETQNKHPNILASFRRARHFLFLFVHKWKFWMYELGGLLCMMLTIHSFERRAEMECGANQSFIREDTHWLNFICDDFNRRLRLEDYRGNVDEIITYIENLAKEKSYEKIIVKARFEHVSLFIEKGFVNEGVITGYFNGSNAYFLVKYLSVMRRISHDWCKEDQIIQSVQAQSVSVSSFLLPVGYVMRKAEEGDAAELAELYKTVFAIYPTPLQRTDYVIDVIKGGTIFYIIEKKQQIVSAASAEINETYHNAEITDCATRPEHRKHGLMKHIISQLENELRQRGIFCAYSLARAKSFGMNAVFQQLGYRYAGRLANNCYIYEDLEDMNVWVKDLSRK
jgi:putative beta-lysine N-acetyltransferase